MISRDEALILMEKYLRTNKSLRFSFAVESILKKIANKLDEDEDLWGLVGLLHNIDYEYTSQEREKRGTLSIQILDGLIQDQGIDAIKANNYINTDHLPTTPLDKSLISAESVTCLIFATINLTPDKKLKSVDLNFLYEKFQDQSFAPNCNRSKIKICSDIGIEVKEFLNMSLETIKEISDLLEL
jgi:hypothetical protein